MQVIAGAGTTLFAGDGGPAANTRLYGPAGMYRDYLGNFYFVDAKNLRVRKINNAHIFDPILERYMVRHRLLDEIPSFLLGRAQPIDRKAGVTTRRQKDA